MAWHKCTRFWKHGASCPVRGMPGHEPEEEEEEPRDEEPREIPKVVIPEREAKRRPPEQGSVMAVAEALIREVETGVVAEPVGEPEPAREPAGVPVVVPDWVPPVREVVVPELFPTPADIREIITTITTTVTPVLSTTETTITTIRRILDSANPAQEVGKVIVEGVIAAGVGVGIGVVGASGFGSRLVTISRILHGLSPQAGYIALPTARTLLIAAGAATVRAVAAKIPDQPPDMMREGLVIDQTMGMVEELVVGYVYPAAADRTLIISRALASVSPKLGPEVLPGSPKSGPEVLPGTPTNPFGAWNDAFMAPGMYGPPPAPPSSTLASAPGGSGYLYDFGQYLNSQLGTLEVPGGSPPPTSY